MPNTIILEDKDERTSLAVEIWDGYVLFTPDNDRCMLFERDEVERLQEHLAQYLEETK